MDKRRRAENRLADVLKPFTILEGRPQVCTNYLCGASTVSRVAPKHVLILQNVYRALPRHHRLVYHRVTLVQTAERLHRDDTIFVRTDRMAKRAVLAQRHLQKNKST